MPNRLAPHRLAQHRLARRPAARRRLLAATVAAVMTLTGCADVVQGKATVVLPPNAKLSVIGDSGDSFDTAVKNALSDVTTFWSSAYPTVSGGKPLPPIKGGLFSIDGGQVVQTGTVAGPAKSEGCVAEKPTFIVDNAAFCSLDDSIVWDRDPEHLIGALAKRYGPLLFALAFAHEFGHAIQYRLGIFKQNPAPLVIDTESQADCAAGAFLATVIAGKAAHYRSTPAQLDQALLGYLQVRDSTPLSGADISHGDGFDRISAIDDGLTHGPTYCFSNTYFDRKFTERPFVTDSDYLSGGNEPLSQVLDPNDPTKDPNAGGLQPDLNRFWTAAAQAMGKTFTPVKIAEAAHPKCGASASSEFGYCPDDNTVYYSTAYASTAYYSLTVRHVDPATGNVTLEDNQAADFALGTLFAMGWGMAVRHQLYGRSTDDQNALLAAACYVGAYSKDINHAPTSSTVQFLLSPPDLDEATSAMLTLVGSDRSFGARGTTGFQRIQSFVKGYNQGWTSC